MFRQMKPRGRWKNPGVPECDPNWVVRFRFGDGTVLTRAAKEGPARFPVCDKCRAVPAGENPVEVRSSCDCQRRARRWAESFLATQGELFQRREFERLEAMRRAPVVTPLAEVVARYVSGGPKTARKAVGCLRRVLEQGAGLSLEDADWSDLTEAVGIDWALVRQEAGRRGWLGYESEARVEAEGWAELRADLRRKRWALDFVNPEPWNTSIASTLAMVRAMFCDHARRYVYTGMTLPEGIGLRDCRVPVPAPDTTFSLSREVYGRMWDGLPLLKETRPEVWGLIWLHWHTGIRPAEARTAMAEDVVRDPATGRLLLRVRSAKRNRVNRADKVRVWALPADLVEVMESLCTGGHILGLDTQWDRAYRAANAWLRACGVGQAHTLYHLRKLVGTMAARRGGLEAAAQSLGNTRAAAEGHYVERGAVLEGFSDAELAPEAVMGAEVVPWRAAG